MPRMDQAAPPKNLIKLLLIGDGKIGKTHFAGMAAASGFNVLYIDGDVAGPTIARLPDAAKRGIYMLSAHDTIMGGMRDHRFIDLMSEFTSNIKFKWNDSQQRLAKVADKTDEIWEIIPGQMDESCVLVIDSWTGLTESMALRAAQKNSVDLADATTNEMRPVYQSSGLNATSMLQVIRSMPCHVIVLGHPDEYQHKTAPEGRSVRDIKENDMIVDWTKFIAKSTSRPHGLQMPKYFTDVAWMEVSPTGTRKLDFRVKSSRVSGGHFDGFEDTDKYSFANLVKQIGGTIPAANTPVDRWLKIIPPGENQPAVAQVLEGGASDKPVKGIASMFGQKAAAPVTT